jgi:tetratricopeptide (TPR) repeat protein
MSLRETRGFKLGLWILTAACLGGAGFLGYKTFFAPSSSARELKAAETAYASGLNAYQQKNWPDAATRFDEAKILADRAMKALETQAEEKKISPEDAQKTQGQIMWVKARAAREYAYAKAQVDGKPLADLTDPVNNETYRTFILIPDPEARAEAIRALRAAADRLTADPEVLKDALRFELVLQPINWQIAEPLLRRALEKDPNDARAHYFLARFEYEQPGDDHVTPTPLERRSPDGMERAKTHLAAAKKAPIGFWRNAGLEVEILDWDVRTGAARKLKPETVAAAEKAVDQTLFDLQTGLLAVAARGEKIDKLGGADARGMVSVLTVGLERAAADARKPGNTPERVRIVAKSALDLANKVANRMAEDSSLKPLFPEIAAVLVAVTAGSQEYLAQADPAAWQVQTSGVESLLARFPEGTASRPLAQLALGEIAATDAALAARNGEVDRAKDLQARALKYVEEGLKAAEAANLPAAEVDTFHAMLAEWKLQLRRRSDEIEPHLAHLRGSTITRARLYGQLLDAHAAERQGRLDQARKLLEPIAADRNQPDLAFRANALLAGLAIATGDLTSALPALKDVEARYNSATLPISARAWADRLLGGSDGITGSLVVLNLGVAQQIAAKYARENPGKAVPVELVSGYVSAAQTLLKKTRVPSPGNRLARVALVNHQLSTGQTKEGEATLDGLATDYPDSLDVLRVRCQYLSAPAGPGEPVNKNGIAAADIVIRKFLRDYPGDKAARLFYAEWLVRTGRAEEAITYLRDPTNFPGGRGDVGERVLAVALFRAGQRDEAQKILSKLPADGAIDPLLLQAATDRAAREKQLKEALGRYEDQGMLRVYEAALNLSDGKYEEAVRGFASAAEFTRVRPTARAGIQRALVAYAEADPAKARDEAVRLSGQMPDEPAVYLAAALASLILEDVGNTEDSWDQTKTMFAALNRWEAAALKGGAKAADLVPIRVQFRLLAGDVAGAKREAANGLTRNPDHVALLLMSAELSLAPPADTARAREFLDAAAKQSPNDPRLPLVDAAIKIVAGDHAGAAAVYEKLVGDSAKSAAYFPQLVASLLAAGKKDDAMRWTRVWVQKFPADNAAAVQLIALLAKDGKKSEAVKVGDDLVARMVADARKKLSEQDPPLPPAEFEKKLDDYRGGALLTAAAGFLRGGAIDEAESRAREVQKSFPTAERVLLMLGDIALARKNWDEAIKVYDQIVKAQPRHYVAGNNLAWILAEKKNNPAAALALVEEVRKGRAGDKPISPGRLPPDFLDTIGVVYLKLNRPERLTEMRGMFEAAVLRYPGDPRMYLYLGHALAGLQNRQRALEMFDVAIRLAGSRNGLGDEQNKTVIDAAEAARKKLQN